MKTALRIDDIGASSKQFEVYSKRFKGLGNVLFFKYLPWFRAWGPYREMTANEWEQVFDILQEFNAKLTVGITAAWVEKDGTIVPFPEKYPEQAAVLKKGAEKGLLEIANHGLTHCVVGKHLPRMMFSNRKFHREFWQWLDDDIHQKHIRQSQQILQDYFQVKITTFVPPGNVYTNVTIEAAKKSGINLINCYTKSCTKNGMRILGEENVFAFHDRELILEGTDYLRNFLLKQPDTQYCFVKEL